MARIPRYKIVVPGEYYHIIARGNERRTVFWSEDDYVTYKNLLAESIAEYDTTLSHYVIMPNHIHLLVRAGQDGLSRLMHHVQSSYAKFFRKKYGNVGHVWQGRFKSLRVANNAHLLACGNYIELNPVRAKMTTEPEHWPHSSYRSYAFGEYVPAITHDQAYLRLSDSGKQRQKIYRNLIKQSFQD